MEFFLDLIFCFYIITIYKCNRVLHVDFVSCYFAEFVYQCLQYFGGFLGFLYRVCVIVKSERLTSFLPIWMPLFLFAVCDDKTSSAMLSRMMGVGIPLVFLTVEEKVFSLLWIVPVGFSYMVFMMLRYVSSMPCWGFLLRKVAVLGQMLFFYIYWEDHIVFILYLIYVLYDIESFVNIELPLQPRNESHLIVVNDSFNVFLDSSCNYFLDNCCIHAHQG